MKHESHECSPTASPTEKGVKQHVLCVSVSRCLATQCLLHRPGTRGMLGAGERRGKRLVMQNPLPTADPVDSGAECRLCCDDLKSILELLSFLPSPESGCAYD